MKRRRQALSFLESDGASSESAFSDGELGVLLRDARGEGPGAPRRDWWMSGADFTGGDYIE